MTRIAVDIDGVLATKLDNGNYPEDYVKKKALDKAVESLKWLNSLGYYVYLFSARYEADREVTEQWLEQHGFKGLYQELILDKPKYDILIDDRAIRHEHWDKTIAKIMELRHKGSWF